MKSKFKISANQKLSSQSSDKIEYLRVQANFLGGIKVLIDRHPSLVKIIADREYAKEIGVYVQPLPIYMQTD